MRNIEEYEKKVLISIAYLSIFMAILFLITYICNLLSLLHIFLSNNGLSSILLYIIPRVFIITYYLFFITITVLYMSYTMGFKYRKAVIEEVLIFTYNVLLLGIKIKLLILAIITIIYLYLRINTQLFIDTVLFIAILLFTTILLELVVDKIARLYTPWITKSLILRYSFTLFKTIYDPINYTFNNILKRFVRNTYYLGSLIISSLTLYYLVLNTIHWIIINPLFYIGFISRNTLLIILYTIDLLWNTYLLIENKIPIWISELRQIYLRYRLMLFTTYIILCIIPPLATVFISLIYLAINKSIETILWILGSESLNIIITIYLFISYKCRESTIYPWKNMWRICIIFRKIGIQ